MHYNPTLRHIPAPALCPRTLAEGVHRGISEDPHNPDTLAQYYKHCTLLISPTSEGWKAQYGLWLTVDKKYLTKESIMVLLFSLLI